MGSGGATSRRGTSSNVMMDFLSKGMMTGRAKLSRIIHVKPYSASLSDDEGEKENIDTTKTLTLTDTPTKDMPKPTRARSLERLPGETGPTELGMIGRNRSFDRKHGRSLGTPELAPVFTTTNTNSFTITKNNLTANSDFKPQKSPIKRRANW